MDESSEAYYKSFADFAKDASYLRDTCRVVTFNKAVLELAKANNDLKESDKYDRRIGIIQEDIKKITDILNTRLIEIIRTSDKLPSKKRFEIELIV